MTRRIFVAIAALAVFCEMCVAVQGTDEEVRRRIVGFLRPKCGGHLTRGEVLRNPELDAIVGLQEDTNRLARILAELAQTNDAWYAEMAMWQLEKYATSEQLPFLYSCATNTVVGDRAVKTVLRIEGVNSNSINVVQNFLMQTNRFPVANIAVRSDLCVDLLTMVFSNPALNDIRPLVIDIVENFERNVDVTPNAVDAMLISVDDSYHYSKRRLEILREAMRRQCIELQDIVHGNHEVWRRTHVYNFQTNYLQNAINELVAYPEANLPD